MFSIKGVSISAHMAPGHPRPEVDDRTLLLSFHLISGRMSWTLGLTGTGGRPSKPQPGRSWRQKLGSGRSSVRPWRRILSVGLEEILANRPAPQKGEAVLCQHCLHSAGGELLTSTEDIVGRWKKYFEDLLNPTDLPSNEEAEDGDSEVDSSITQAEVTEVVSGDHTSQPPREGLRQGTGEENSADSRPPRIQEEQCGFRSWSWNSGPALYPPQGARGFMGVCPTSPHVLCGSGEGIHDRVPRGILWECSVSDMGSGAFAKGCSVSVRPEQELGSHCRQISRRSQGPEGVRFGNHRISSLLFADDVVLLASSSQDLQHVLERFAAECEAAGMRISTSKSEAMVLDRKRVACPLRVGGEVLPQVEEFKYLGVLFTSEGKMEREIDRRIGAASAVMRSV
ncbi:hypothetical protein L3Q82_016420 [Scortum barcoo]|uniref:Uncharacterized protein n=1 Tax=Scortum barcoo TaxID=214431 RepID=A0ACB8X8P6_9TELE|nr:hypothetical protein L3Q82_016420 [Scortum barcoo]